MGSSVVVDTRVLPKAHRDIRWKNATAEFLVPLEITTPGLPVTGRIAGATRGDVSLCHLQASAHVGVRTAELAEGRGSDCCKVAVATHGRVTVRQHGRTAQLRPGEWTVYDIAEEYEVGSDHSFGLFVALVPRVMLGERAQLAARAAMVFEVPDVSAALLEAARAGASLDPALASIANLLHDSGHTYRRSGGSDDEIFHEAIRLIESHQTDEALGPAYLSAVLGVSRRRLYDIFDRRAGPIARYIRTRRLASARALLANPANAGLAVSEVAIATGFTDPAHFSRLFRAAYGYPPSRLRAQRAS